MNLLQLKEKYKQILEEPESEQSDDEWELAYSQMKNKRRRHILTESSCQNSNITHNDDIMILKTKEKLAQCMSTIAKKDTEIEELKKENIKAHQKIKTHEKQIEELKQSLQKQQKNIIDQKVAYGCIEKNIQNISRTYEEQKMDKQLMKRQIQFYRNEIEALKSKLNEKDRQINEVQKSVRYSEKYKGVNQKLKNDITRLRQLLTETQKYKVFANSSQYKHYIGKPSKEHECWFSQNLIEDVQKFMKKHQINGNKELMNHFVRFVQKHVEETKKKVQKKAKKQAHSRIKQIERKQNHSLNFMEIREQTLRKSLMRSSMCKSRRTNTLNTLNDSKRCTESFIYDKLEKSLVTHEINHNRELCCQMLNSFRKGITQMLYAKDLKRKKILKLVDWLLEGILSIFPREKAMGSDFRLDTEQIKIVQ